MGFLVIVTLRDVENCLIALNEIDAVFPDQDDPGPDLDELERHREAVEWLVKLHVELKKAENELEMRLNDANDQIKTQKEQIKSLRQDLKSSKAKLARIQGAIKGEF